MVGGVNYNGEDFFREHACLTGMPRERFNTYWNERLTLAGEAYADFKGIFEKENAKKNPTPPPIPQASTARNEKDPNSLAMLAKRKLKHGY